MTDEPESSFADRVFEWADEWALAATQNYRLPSRRVVDVLALTEPAKFVIEVENDFEAAVKGVGQAAIYADGVDRSLRPVYPLVVVPTGHVEEPERTALERRTGIPVKTADELGIPS